MGTLLLVGCDHATKHTAQGLLMGQPGVKLIEGVLDLRYVENRAMAFGVLEPVPRNIRWPIVCTGHALTVAALTFLCWRLRRGRPLLLGGLFLALAGGVGNLIDRLARGYVIDFIHVHHWPVFNVADICVSAGVGLLLIYLARSSTTRTSPAVTRAIRS